MLSPARMEKPSNTQDISQRTQKGPASFTRQKQLRLFWSRLTKTVNNLQKDQDVSTKCDCIPEQSSSVKRTLNYPAPSMR